MNLDFTPRETAGIPLPEDANVVGLRLSRTNLETLLAKLDRPGSAATILRQVTDGEEGAVAPTIVVVKAEEDAEHYANAARQDDVRGKRGAMLEDGATSFGQVIEVAE